MSVLNSLKVGFLIFLVFASVGRSDEPASDPTGKKLEKARSTYQTEAEKLKSSVTETLEKRLEAARKVGKKEHVDSLNREIESYEAGGPIPSFLPDAYQKKQIVMLQKMEKSLESAVRDYTKAGKDAEAESLSMELRTVRKVLKLIELRKVIVGTWNIKMVKGIYTADMIFNADGTGYQTTEKQNAKWTYDDSTDQVIFTFDNGVVEKVVLPIDPRQTKMINRFGTEFIMMKK